ncbi:MAG: histidine kinase [Burkholderiales bacterium]|nr:histidine kinase [Burkholderiales bacterium]
MRGWAGRLARAAALLAALAAQVAQAQVLELTQADVVSSTRQGTRRETATLPYHWDRQHGGLPGSATFDIPFTLPATQTGGMAIYLSRIGNAYSLELNDVLLQEKGDLQVGGGADYAKAPRLVDIPAGLLGERNLLRVRIRADSGRRGGLSAVVVGPGDEVEAMYRSDLATQNGVSLAVTVLSLVVATAALALWLTQKDPRRPRGGRDRLYLYVCIAELSWALRMANLDIEQVPMDWRPWSVLMVVTVATWEAGMLAFSCEIADWARQRLGRLALGAAWLLPLLGAMAADLGWQRSSTLPVSIFYATSALVLMPFVVLLCRAALRPGASIELRLLAITISINAVVSVRDLVLFRFGSAYGQTIWLRYSAALFGLTLGYIVIVRFRHANAALRDLLGSLAQQVAAKEDELRHSYAQLEQLARQQERASERGRILRDMHDGVGAHLSAAIRQLQSGRGVREEVLATLRDALEQLKLSIDAMNLPPGDVNALLAGLRYRLEPRFAASDLKLEWDVEELQPLPRLDPAAMRHLQFMVFEALSNVLQHARARVLRIEASRLGAGARVRIVDDGCGFDVAGRARKGLQAMRDRAAAIGAELLLQSRPGETVVQISLAP